MFGTIFDTTSKFGLVQLLSLLFSSLDFSKGNPIANPKKKEKNDRHTT